MNSTTPVKTSARNSPTPPLPAMVNGISPPSPSTTPLSEESQNTTTKLSISKANEDNIRHDNDGDDDDDDDEKMDTTPAKEDHPDEMDVSIGARHKAADSGSHNNNNNNNNSDSVLRKSPTMESNNEHNSESSLNFSRNNNIDKLRANAATDTRTLIEQLAAKEKEVSFQCFAFHSRIKSTIAGQIEFLCPRCKQFDVTKLFPIFIVQRQFSHVTPWRS